MVESTTENIEQVPVDSNPENDVEDGPAMPTEE